jgi:hypothetical protein
MTFQIYTTEAEATFVIFPITLLCLLLFYPLSDATRSESVVENYGETRTARVAIDKLASKQFLMSDFAIFRFFRWLSTSI